jgi:ankyrin repeat protein
METSQKKQKMNRENMIYRTFEIKSELIKNCNDIMSKMTFYIYDKNLQKIKAILESSNFHIDQKDVYEDSLLIIAVKSKCYEIVDYLIKNQADVNITDKDLNTPLHHALMNRYYKIANLLISKKADEFMSNKKGMTPWMFINLDTENG